MIGGPGWRIDDESLRCHITDMPAFRAEFADDPMLEVLCLAWTDQPAAALGLLDDMPDGLRRNALRGDCLRDLGRHGEATDLYEELVEQTRGTAREAVIAQHAGKAFLAAGNLPRARTLFERAHEIRSAAGDATLIASTELALQALARAEGAALS